MSNGYYFCAGFGLGSVNLERNPPIPVYVESPVWVLTEMGFLPSNVVTTVQIQSKKELGLYHGPTQKASKPGLRVKMSSNGLYLWGTCK